METLYLNPRAWRVRIAQAAIWLGAAACLWLAFSTVNPSDDSLDRLVVYLAAAFMLCAVVAFEIYLRLYVLRIEGERDTLVVTTLATVHHRSVRLPVAAVSLGRKRREQAPPIRAPGYDNSWRGLRLEGQRFPFIVDVTEPTRLDR